MLMSRFLQALDDEVDDLHKNGIRLSFVGNLQQLSPALRERMDAAAALTAGNSKMTLVIAIAYGGRWDIASAARRLAERCVAGETCAWTTSTRRSSAVSSRSPACRIPTC